ncbi:Proline dehydrogenase 1, mitochondrial [Capsicum baccatum]|uniref:Proline dehydrogenase 1, mitochondrial n=1 Tax=Capsicum baccatum TaxID=33114 RepID=A0A2G2W825_CAPBA|nr:Proline dehydrogenase 1, mitochondrial [Capsicum baccatum]
MATNYQKLRKISIGSSTAAAEHNGVKHATKNESPEQSTTVFIQTIESTKSLTQFSANFAVAKITAICTPRLIKRISDLLRWEKITRHRIQRCRFYTLLYLTHLCIIYGDEEEDNGEEDNGDLSTKIFKLDEDDHGTRIITLAEINVGDSMRGEMDEKAGIQRNMWL